MGTPNWGNLVKKGRAKAFGVPWSEEEAVAFHTYKIPAEYIRAGVKTPEEYAERIAEETKAGKKDLEVWNHEELFEEARRLNLKITPEATPDALVNAITDQYALLNKQRGNKKKDEPETEADVKKREAKAKKDADKADKEKQAKLDKQAKSDTKEAKKKADDKSHESEEELAKGKPAESKAETKKE